MGVICDELISVLLKHTHREQTKRSHGREGGSSRFLDGFELDTKWFLRDRCSSKFLGKLYKLSNVFNRLKIELEIVMEYVF